MIILTSREEIVSLIGRTTKKKHKIRLFRLGVKKSRPEEITLMYALHLLSGATQFEGHGNKKMLLTLHEVDPNPIKPFQYNFRSCVAGFSVPPMFHDKQYSSRGVPAKT